MKVSRQTSVKSMDIKVMIRMLSWSSCKGQVTAVLYVESC